MNSEAWRLPLHLERESASLGDLPLSRVLLIKDANYPWLMLVPRRPNVTEITELSETDRAQLMSEIALAASALQKLTACDKLNIATLGNIVPQLHVHIVARRKTDVAWPRPVWGYGAPRAYEEAELDRFFRAVAKAIGL
jgi:diadenosine tetraphosphate (Ap4A) HIT family hydrolase